MLMFFASKFNRSINNSSLLFFFKVNYALFFFVAVDIKEKERKREQEKKKRESERKKSEPSFQKLEIDFQNVLFVFVSNILVQKINK